LFVQPAWAEVVLSALEQRESELPGEHLGQERQILRRELLLQGDVRGVSTRPGPS
jgi:hypothetical protein